MRSVCGLDVVWMLLRCGLDAVGCCLDTVWIQSTWVNLVLMGSTCVNLSCFGLTKKKYLDYYLFETKKQLGFFLRLVYGLLGVTTVVLVQRGAGVFQ